jgi:hypothetical protein
MTHFLPSSLAQGYVSGVIQISLQLTVTVIYDPELDFLKQNWVMTAEWSTLDSLRPIPLLNINMCPEQYRHLWN